MRDMTGFRSAAAALAESQLAGLIERGRLLGEIAELLTRACGVATPDDPELAPPRYALDGQTVVITVGSPARAAKLRQRSPEMTRLLQAQWPDLTGIRIRLQPGGEPPARGAAGEGVPTTADPLPPPDPALRFADDLAENLPDSALRRAALRLRDTLRLRAAETPGDRGRNDRASNNRGANDRGPDD